MKANGEILIKHYEPQFVGAAKGLGHNLSEWKEAWYVKPSSPKTIQQLVFGPKKSMSLLVYFWFPTS